MIIERDTRSAHLALSRAFIELGRYLESRFPGTDTVDRQIAMVVIAADLEGRSPTLAEISQHISHIPRQTIDRRLRGLVRRGLVIRRNATYAVGAMPRFTKRVVREYLRILEPAVAALQNFLAQNGQK